MTHLLNRSFYDKLKSLDFVSVLFSQTKGNLTSFNIKGVHPHDVGTFLSSKNIAVRVGKHCAYPLHYHLNINSSIRVSFAIYNTYDEVNYIIEMIKQCHAFFTKD